MFKTLLVIIVCSAAASCSTVATKVKNPDDAKRPFLGVEFFSEPVKLKARIDGYRGGLLMNLVYPDSPAYKAGLRSKDILVEINEKKVTDFNFKSGSDFTDFMAVQEIGSTIKFRIVRDEKNLIEIPVVLQGRKYSFGRSYENNKKFELKTKSYTDKINWQSYIKKYDIEKEVDELRARFKLMTSEGDQLRLPIVASLHDDPFKILPYSYWIKDQLDIKSSEPLAANGHFLLELNNSSYRPSRMKDESSAIDQLVTIYKTAQAELDHAFDDLSPAAKESLKNDLPGLAKKFSDGNYIQIDENKINLEKNLNTISNIQKIKPIHFVQAYALLTKNINESLLARIFSESTQRLATSKISQLRIPSVLGDILIAGTGNDVHAEDPNHKTFLIIDLGGDDQYQSTESNIIDYGGNDSYETATEWTMAGSTMDIKFIIDQKGDDRYIGHSGSFASTLFGVSFLWDKEGNDEYRCVKYCFGTAFGGVSVLLDEKGNDRYESLQMSQGLGIAGGIGLLLDHGGNDSYYSKGGLASGYGDAGQFAGWSQGVGVGLRGFVSGGFGLLYDRAGKDIFESGDFSQGGGYYFGWGLLIKSGKENDKYIASRYSQGFAAHYAVGTFLEEGGNDQYISKHVVGQGLSWDLGITLFEDFAGNDTYKTCAHCLGTAAQNGITFFIDDSGDDIYKGAQLPYTENVPNDYHSGVSLGFFVDLGHGHDQYEIFKNNSEKLRPKYQILIDQ